jgi:hypothetical protein
MAEALTPFSNSALVTLKSAGSKISWATIAEGTRPSEMNEDTRMLSRCSTNAFPVIEGVDTDRMDRSSKHVDDNAKRNKSVAEVASRVFREMKQGWQTRAQCWAGSGQIVYVLRWISAGKSCLATGTESAAHSLCCTADVRGCTESSNMVGGD